MRKAPALLALATLAALSAACSDANPPLTSPDLETVIAADLGGLGLSQRDRAAAGAVAEYLASNQNANGAVFFPSGSTGLYYIEIGTDDGGFPTLAFCAFIGDGPNDWDRLNPDGSITVHKSVKGAQAIYDPGTLGSPEYQGVGNFTMRATGFQQTLSDPSGGTIVMVVPSGGAQVMWGNGTVRELAGWDGQGQPIYTGPTRDLRCGEVTDALGNIRKAGIFFD